MSYLYATRTVHAPVTAVGNRIENSFGVPIATCHDSFVATAMAMLINAGNPVLKAEEDAYDKEEADRFSRMFRARQKMTKAE